MGIQHISLTPLSPWGRDAGMRDISSPSLSGPPWLTRPWQRLQEPLWVRGVGWQAAQPGLTPCGIDWRPQQSFPGPKVPAGVEQHGSSAALIYTEHLLQGEGRNTLKHCKFRWWSSPGSPSSPAARVSRPWQRAESWGRIAPRERREKGCWLVPQHQP